MGLEATSTHVEVALKFAPMPSQLKLRSLEVCPNAPSKHIEVALRCASMPPQLRLRLLSGSPQCPLNSG